jgi:hypothetical protein
MKKYYALALCGLITACGGGGGDSGGSTPAPVANVEAQGLWSGTGSTGYTLNAVILETGEFYSMFSSGGVAYGIDYGTGTSSGSTFSGSLVEFYIPTNQTFTGNLAGTVTAKSSLSGSTTYNNGNTGTFSMVYNTAYDTPATLSAITGTYTGTYYTGAPVTMAVTSTGVVNGTSTNCSFTGTALPRSTGKNVYNVNLTFTGSQCAPGAGTASGIAVLGTSNGSTYIYTAGINSAKTNGFFWIGRGTTGGGTTGTETNNNRDYTNVTEYSKVSTTLINAVNLMNEKLLATPIYIEDLYTSNRVLFAVPIQNYFGSDIAGDMARAEMLVTTLKADYPVEGTANRKPYRLKYSEYDIAGNVVYSLGIGAIYGCSNANDIKNPTAECVQYNYSEVINNVVKMSGSSSVNLVKTESNGLVYLSNLLP